MPDYASSFPSRELADQELAHDPCSAKIPVQDRAAVVERAWRKGEQAARDIFAKYGGERDFFQIAAGSGLVCACVDRDYVSGNRRCFSEYDCGRNMVYLYLGSIRVWAQENGVTLETAQNMILSHEYFHFLEWTELGLASREYQVPMLELGPLKLGKTGVRALSEIGAHAFARTYYELLQA